MPTGDKTIDAPLADIIGLVELVALYDHPLTRTGENVGGRGKPTSRPPGASQCGWAVRRTAAILAKARADLLAVVDAAQPRQPRPDVILRVGGIVVTEKRRREDGTFALDRDGLAAKMRDVLG